MYPGLETIGGSALVDPNFKFRKTAEKIEAAINRRDGRAFASNIEKLLANLANVPKDKKLTQPVQEAYKKIEDFVSFAREIVATGLDFILFLVGSAHESFGNMDKAVAYWREALKSQMSRPLEEGAFETFHKLSTYFVRKELTEETYELAQTFQTYVSDQSQSALCPDTYVFAHSRIASLLLNSGKHKECLKCCMKGLTIKGVSEYYQTIGISFLYDTMAKCYTALGNLKMTEKVIKTNLIPLTQKWKESRTIKLNFSRHCDALARLGGCLVKADKVQEAIETYQELLDHVNLSPMYFDEFELKDPTYHIQDYESDARATLSELKMGKKTIFKEHSSDAFRIDAEIALKGKNYQKAIDSANQATILLTGRADYYYLECLPTRGKAYFGLKMYKEAISDFQIGIKIAAHIKNEEELVKCYKELIKCYLTLEYLPECIEVCDQALNVLPMHERLMTMEGYLKSKEYDRLFKLLDEYQKSAQPNKILGKRNRLLASIQRAKALFLLGDYESCKASFQKIFEGLKDDKSILRFIALAYYGNCLRKLEESPDLILKTFDEAFQLYDTFEDKEELRPLRSSLLLNKCIVYTEMNKKADPNKILNLQPLSSRKLIATGIFNLLMESDTKKVLKLMIKHYKMKELQSVQPDIHNFANSISITQHFKSLI